MISSALAASPLSTLLCICLCLGSLALVAFTFNWADSLFARIGRDQFRPPHPLWFGLWPPHRPHPPFRARWPWAMPSRRHPPSLRSYATMPTELLKSPDSVWRDRFICTSSHRRFPVSRRHLPSVLHCHIGRTVEVSGTSVERHLGPPFDSPPPFELLSDCHYLPYPRSHVGTRAQLPKSPKTYVEGSFLLLLSALLVFLPITLVQSTVREGITGYERQWMKMSSF